MISDIREWYERLRTSRPPATHRWQIGCPSHRTLLDKNCKRVVVSDGITFRRNVSDIRNFTPLARVSSIFFGDLPRSLRSDHTATRIFCSGDRHEVRHQLKRSSLGQQQRSKRSSLRRGGIRERRGEWRSSRTRPSSF